MHPLLERESERKKERVRVRERETYREREKETETQTEIEDGFLSVTSSFKVYSCVLELDTVLLYSHRTFDVQYFFINRLVYILLYPPVPGPLPPLAPTQQNGKACSIKRQDQRVVK